MELVISELVTFYQKYNPFELAFIRPEEYYKLPADMLRAKFGDNPIKIKIKDSWYDVLTLSQVVRSQSEDDGYYHFLYIQINWATDEYYIGKANRKRWSELKRYQGSGLKFRQKYNAHASEFTRYFFACCGTREETEKLEAEIVDDILLADPKCLNLVKGGGGTNEHYGEEGRREKLRNYMKAHPEQYRAMIEKNREINESGSSHLLEKRRQSIKKTMSNDHYRDMFRERLRKWREEHPEEYKKAREKNRQAMQSPETKEKKRKSREKWKTEHPEEYAALQEKLTACRTSPEANEKRKASLKAWNQEHPEEARANAKKRSEASVEKSKKGVHMCDLNTGEIIRTFDSQIEAAQWLVDNGIAKNTNCRSSISQVCLRKPCSTGYGFRKQAYGYTWRFAEEDT